MEHRGGRIFQFARAARTARRRPAFTLVELLVVLAIIGLLLSILIPVVAAARTRANGLTCKSQLRQIGQAVRMYLAENKDHYPLAPALPSVNPNGYPTLMACLGKYLGNNPAIYHCPCDEQLYLTEQTSYLYDAQLGTDPLEANVFYQVFQSREYVPVALDAGNFHGAIQPFNCLFLDGRVEQVAAPKELQ
ncbi:MAG: prepilin-type N-terminal cleavage/methylation domain-containing protein [Tepidisphaeraceae bacterium]|jgi:prepilin-type N-terminal cleavage/methylation domain-containing protein